MSHGQVGHKWLNVKDMNMISISLDYTVTSVLSGHSKRRLKLVFKTDYRLMKVQSIVECSKGSILQYLRPSLSYHLSIRSLFCLF